MADDYRRIEKNHSPLRLMLRFTREILKNVFLRNRAHLVRVRTFVRINFDHDGFAPTKRTRNKFSLFFLSSSIKEKKKERGKKEHSILHSIYRRNFEIRRCVWTARGPRIKGSGRCAEADAANASPPLANLVSPRLENRTRAIPAMISRRGTGLKACSQSRAHPASDRACSILLRIRVRKLFSAISRLENVWRFFFSLFGGNTGRREKGRNLLIWDPFFSI